MEDSLRKIVSDILQLLKIEVENIEIVEIETIGKDKGRTFRVDINTNEAATLIGYHGETIYALQHLLKTIMWKQTDSTGLFIVLDVDSYRKRQEESVLSLAMRKVEEARKTMQDQRLPPMSPYFRRVIHLALAKEEYADIVTESEGSADHRSVIIKVRK